MPERPRWYNQPPAPVLQLITVWALGFASGALLVLMVVSHA